MSIRSIVLVLALLARAAAADSDRSYVNWGTVKARGHGTVTVVPPPVRPRPVVWRELVRVGEPAVSGELDAPIVRRHLLRKIQWLSHCYEKELLTRPNLSSGILTVTFEISPDGIVRTARASGIDRVVTGCAVIVIVGIEFPKRRRGTVTVTVPITFGP